MHKQGRKFLASLSQSLDHISNLHEVRGVIRVSGPTLVHFLQGLVTNDVTPLESKDYRLPIYSCILNAQGRYLHDLFIHPTAGADPPSSSTPTVLIDVDAPGKDEFLRLLKRYRLRQKIEIDDVSSEYSVWVAFGHDNVENTGENREAALIPPVSWPRDPRLDILGYRTILPNTNALDTNYRDANKVSETVPWQEYRRWRILHGIAEGDTEIPFGDAIALEYNIDGLNGISFTKGCYVGQELMARTHFKGVVRKRLMPVELQVDNDSSHRESDASQLCVEGEGIIDEKFGKTIGNIRVIDGRQGLAVVRLKEATAGGLRTATEGLPVVAKRPSWWPDSWGRE